MEINRNQWFMIGLIVLAMGIQFRMVQTFVLNEKTTEIIAKRLKKAETVTTTFIPSFESEPPASHRSLEPPRWIGFMLIAVGSVLVLHSFAMPRPGLAWHWWHSVSAAPTSPAHRAPCHAVG